MTVWLSIQRSPLIIRIPLSFTFKSLLLFRVRFPIITSVSFTIRLEALPEKVREPENVIYPLIVISKPLILSEVKSMLDPSWRAIPTHLYNYSCLYAVKEVLVLVKKISNQEQQNNLFSKSPHTSACSILFT